VLWVAKMDVPGARLKQTLGFVNISSLYRTSFPTDGGLDGKSGTRRDRYQNEKAN
jgi:hypothetical protein